MTLGPPIQEKVLSDVSPPREIPPDVSKTFHGGGALRYGDKKTTDWRRTIKSDWNAHADMSFFQDPKKFQVIHYLGYYSEKTELGDYFNQGSIDRMYIDAGVKAGLLRREDESIEMFMTDPDFYGEVTAQLSNALRVPGIHVPGRDELSCFGYAPPLPIGHIASRSLNGFFTFKKYRVTFASNEDAATERLSNAEMKDKERMSSSGLAKRPSVMYNPKDAPLDREGLHISGEAGEVIIDNWIIDTYYGPKRHKRFAEGLGLRFVEL